MKIPVCHGLEALRRSHIAAIVCVLPLSLVDGVVLSRSQNNAEQFSNSAIQRGPGQSNSNSSVQLTGAEAKRAIGSNEDNLHCWMHPPAPSEEEKVVHFIRHAEGWHNVDRQIAMTVKDPTLTPNGIGQAMRVKDKEQLADFLSDDPDRRVQLLVISPAVRTLQTSFTAFPGLLSNAGAQHWRPEVLLEPLIREVDPNSPGCAANTPDLQIGAQVLEAYNNSNLLVQYRALPSGWDTEAGVYAPEWANLQDRFQLFTDKLLSRPERRIIVVTHGQFMFASLNQPMRNADIASRILSPNGEWRHLPPGACSLAGRSDSCACLNWKQTYGSDLVTCGKGMEGRFCGGRTFDPRNNFFRKVSNNYCAKVAPAAALEQSWCYVSPACKDLRGGNGVNEHVSWKWCEEGSRLGDLQPRELFQKLAKDDLLWVSSMSTMLAYPVETRFDISRARAYWDAPARKTMNMTLRAQIQDVVDSGRPKIICEEISDNPSNGPCMEKKPPGGPYNIFVVSGQEFWSLEAHKLPVCVVGC